jgi:hypothetical protein
MSIKVDVNVGHYQARMRHQESPPPPIATSSRATWKLNMSQTCKRIVVKYHSKNYEKKINYAIYN